MGGIDHHSPRTSQLAHCILPHIDGLTNYIMASLVSQRDQADAVETLKNIAKKYSLTQAQVMLKWLVERGNTAVIPGSGNPAHMKSNLGIFSAALSSQDIAEIGTLRGDSRFMYMDMREQPKSEATGEL